MKKNPFTVWSDAKWEEKHKKGNRDDKSAVKFKILEE